MNKPHYSHRRTQSKPQTLRGVKRAWRLAAIHALAAITDGHAWNALALTAMATMAAIPSELLTAHAWLRTAVPIALAGVGMLQRAAGRHAEIAEKSQ